MEQTNFFGNIDKQIIINNAVIENLKISNSFDRYPQILSSFKTHIDFQERNEELNVLRGKLLASNHILVVNGMGGLGKSTIANALSLLDINEYKHLIWINISQGLKKSIVSNKQLIRNLNLVESTNKVKLFYDAEKQDNEIFDIIISAIRNISEKSLFVLDDANNDFDSEFSQLCLNPNWKIVITSRIKHNNIETYELPSLTKEKAVNLFYYYSKIKKNDDTTKVLGRIVSYIWLHTLSIELLAKTIANSFDLTAAKLETLMLSNGFKEIPEYRIKTAYFSEKTRQKKLVTSALKCLKIAFDIGDFRLSATKSKILIHFALLPPIPLTFEILIEVFDLDSKNSVEFQNQLRILIDTGWIVQTTEGLYMHPIIQESIRNSFQLGIENSINFITNLTRIINRYQDVEKSNLTLYVAFANNLLKTFELANYNKPYLNFILSFSKALNTIGYPKDVLMIIDKIPSDSNFEDIRLEIDFEKAKALLILEKLDESLEILTFISGSSSDQTQLKGELLYHIGIVYKKMHDKSKDDELNAARFLDFSMQSIEKCLIIFENLPDSEIHVSASYLLKAQLFRRQGEADLAIIWYEKAKEIRLKVFGESHFKTALVFLDLGVIYNERKNYEVGIEYTKKAIDILSNYYGDDSLEIAVPYHNYAHCFFVNEQYDKALEYELKAFEILKSNVSIHDSRYKKAEKKLNKIKELMQ